MFLVPAPLHFGQGLPPVAILSGMSSGHAPVMGRPSPPLANPNLPPLVASPQRRAFEPGSAPTILSQSERFPPETSTPASPQSIATPQPETTPQQTPSEDELFEQVFKRPRVPKGTQRLPIPFLINGEEQGQLLVFLTPGGTPAVRLQAAPLLQKTATLVRPDIQAKLQSAVDPEGNLALDILSQNGMGAIFDDRRLELQIQVLPTLRATNLVGGQLSNLPPEAKDALPPSSVSGYLNVRGGQNFVWSGRSNQFGRQPLQLDLEGALNIKGWVVEGFANVVEHGQPAWQRGDLRLVRDDPAKSVRYLVGDLSIPVTGYQTSHPMFGITVARNFSLQPYRVTRPISEFQFFLEQPSRVEVYSNGQRVQTLQLPAGSQDIRSLPLSTGFNNVQLIITDPVGRVQRLDFSTSVADNLLAPGLQQFAYSLGFPTTVERSGYAYDWSKPILTLSHRWGANATLTMGGYFQGDVQQQLAGIEGVWATPLGNVGWDAAVSHANQAGTDYALRLRYDYAQSGAGNPQQRRFGLAAEYRGAQFTTLSVLEPHNSTRWDLSAYYSQRLFWGMSGQLNIRYQMSRETSDAYQISVGLSKAFSAGLGVNLTLSQTRNVIGPDETRALANLSWLLPGRRQSLQLSTDVRNTHHPVSNLTWNYSSPQTVEGINASVEASHDGDTYGFKGDLAYTGYRAKVELVQDLALAHNQNGASLNATRLTFGTAIVFAGGRFGWSRPVTGSFAIVARNSALRGHTVGITPGSGSYVARADRLGSAVVPNLHPYRVSTLQLDAPELPLGYDLGRDRYYLLPTYKSGTLIQVGTDATIFVRGTLLNPNGQPISMQAGVVQSRSDAGWQPINLFTNRGGRFALSGLKPGRYELWLYANPKAVIPFELPAGKTGVVDLGQLQAPVPVP